MDRLLRFESMIAICALLISAITGAAVIYQTRVIQSQYAAAIWPYLSVDTNVVNQRRVEIVLVNDGLGPALMRSAQLLVDGRHVKAWGDLELLIRKDLHGQATFGSSSINASTTVRPGDTHSLFSVILGRGVSPTALTHHQAVLKFCYCSLNDSCWSLRSVPGKVTGEYPQRVASCAIDAGIATNLY